ncbi:MAG: transcription-repair coupling factor [Candidatus Abyssobacteria bacterium SURF_5]|uniref:Transcription-repair-coupling factor n=1 Tax=Abyssobacteria bacterium (strain SURF_5) TaxID=2093360 RepID=A0A3A4P416_ABYX5|nr:MAG: transcription-repair coupling factor [Candidatus Abyssubacteria bacterium SURF_5]
MIERVRNTAVFREAAESVGGGGRFVWAYGLWGAARRLFAAELAEASDRVLLYVTSTRDAAETALGDLESFYRHKPLHLFPPREYLPPSDVLPPDQNVSERMLTLRALLNSAKNRKRPFIVAPVRSLLQYLAKPGRVEPLLLSLHTGDNWPLEQLSLALVERGYRRRSMIDTRGEFSIRGGIVDIFPICAEDPYRLEFFGDEIESIRVFDPLSQRSFEQVQQMEIMPRNFWIDSPDSEGDRTTLFEYLPEDAMVVWDEPLAIEAEAGSALAAPAFDMGREPIATLDGVLQGSVLPMLCLSRFKQSSDRFSEAAGLTVQCHSLEPISGRLTAFVDKLDEWLQKRYQVVIVCNNQGESKRLMELLQDAGMHPHFHAAYQERTQLLITLGRLKNGFALDEAELVVASDQEIFQRYTHRRPRKKFKGGAPIANFTDLRVGDYVVHVNHGIGLYRGIVYLPEQKSEFLVLEYLDGDKLYVPVNMLQLVQKYVGSDDEPPKLYKLGGTAWFRVQERVRRAIRDMAGELLDLYAARQVLPGIEFSQDGRWQGEFEEAFLYRETEDQLSAIEDVKEDMERPHPMDRLICGDVGYGKTEVALRAAFKCVMDSRQVAILVPTTILAQQHYTTFRERLADYPVRVEMLSRFKSAAEQKKIVAEVAEGKIDIVIGTHRLIQNDIAFKNLGLIVIDEEQRFGVAHKERLKQLRKMVDVLTLTATPIPRTLHMALMGVRDMSVINTAPEERLSVITVVAEYNEKLIREAVLREMAREGQVFFVHNRVETINRMANFLRRLIPEARIETAHGQMRERELQSVMERFLEKEIDVLTCTTIIGSGLDIPTVNTMLINRADAFGLADLYQLRGRVGRYKHRAYAYLLIPGHKALSEVAQKRLKAIEEFSELGSGFKIALRDLEIRGAGNILGAEQHGDIAAVGFEMYCQLLEEAVAELRGEKPEKLLLPTAEFELDSLIPDSYVSSPSQKLSLYKKIGLARSEAHVDQIVEEIQDRYGQIPPETRNLVDLARVRVLGAAAGLEFIGKIGGNILYRPAPGKDFTADELADLSRTFGKKLHLETMGGLRLLMPAGKLEPEELLRDSIEVVRRLAILRTKRKEEPAAPNRQVAAAKR